jgi:AraC family transcriptional regulator
LAACRPRDPRSNRAENDGHGPCGSCSVAVRDERKDNAMDWQERMNAALDYIEDHLEEEVEWERAAAEANCSEFHFFRMFQVIAGVPVMEYVRRRRLSLAALELASGKAKVIDLAVRLGYDSPDSFGKAFKRELGLTPSEARAPGARLKTWPRFSFSIVLKGVVPMNFRIENHEAIKITGLPLHTSTEDNRNFSEIPAFWEKTTGDKSCQRLGMAVPPGSRFGVMGVSADFDAKTQEFTYLIAIETPMDRSRLPAGCIDKTAKAGIWAIFESRGPLPKAFQETVTRVYGEWFPTSGYEHAGGIELEVYPEGDMKAPDYYCELWVPVKKTST